MSTSERRQSDKPTPPDGNAQDRRESVVDRRVFSDRREVNTPPATGLDRRRGPGRRLSDFSRAAEEGELTKEQFLFLMTIEGFKKANRKVYPSWTDVLEVVRLLGYRKTMPSEIQLRNAEDWTEAPDAPADVRPKRREAA